MKFRSGCGIITYLLGSSIFAGDFPDKNPQASEASPQSIVNTGLMMSPTNVVANEEDRYQTQQYIPRRPPSLELGDEWLGPNEIQLAVILELADVSEEEMQRLPLTIVMIDLAKIKRQIKEIKGRLQSNPAESEKILYDSQMSQLISARDTVAKKNEYLADQIDGALFEKCRKYANKIAGLSED